MLGVSSESLKQSVARFQELPLQLQKAITMNRYKTIDCRLLHAVMLDLRREKMLAKVRDDGFIFLFNRAQSLPQQAVRSNVIARNLKPDA